MTPCRDTWVRSKEANVEIFTPDDPGPLEITFDAGQQLPVLLGTVATAVRVATVYVMQ